VKLSTFGRLNFIFQGESNMRTLWKPAGLLLVVFALVISGSAVFAQDDMTDPGTIVCDADVILSLYNAEYHFDYAAILDASGAEPGFTLADFDYGQFTPLFDGMMAMPDDDMSMDDTMMTGMTGMMSMGMDDMMTQIMGMMDNSMMEGMTMLAPQTVADEPAECTALRDNLRQFYIALAVENVMSSMMMEATPAQ
jgi:hypothetical protein